MHELKPELDSRHFDIFIDKAQATVHLEFSGTVSLKDLVDSFSATIHNPDFVTNMSALYDLRLANVELDLTETEIFFHFAAGLRDKRGDSYALAFVCADEMTKMVANFYRLFLVRTDIDVLICDDFKQALDWIEQHNRSLPDSSD